MSAAIMLVTFALVLVVPLQYAVLAGAAISVVKYIYLVVARRARHAGGDSTTTDAAGERRLPRRSRATAVTVLDIYGSLFFAAAPRIRESLPAVGDAHCPVVVLRLRGRGTLHSATIAVLREYAAECAAARGADVPRRRRAGDGGPAAAHRRAASMLGPDAVVAATDELYGACATAQQRGREWLAAR